LKRNPLHPQTPAQAVFTPDLTVDTPTQAVFEPELVVDDYHPAGHAGDVLTSVDDYQHAEVYDALSCIKYPGDTAGNVDNCHPAEDVFTSVDACCQQTSWIHHSHLCQHAKDVSDLIVDDCSPAGYVLTPIDPPSIEIDKCHAAGEPRPRVEIDDCHAHPACDVVKSIGGGQPHLKPLFIDIEYRLGDIVHLHVEYLRYNFKHCTRFKRCVFTSVDHLRYNFRRRKRRKRWKREIRNGSMSLSILSFLPRKRWSYNIIAVIFKRRKRVTLQKKRLYLTVIVTNIVAVLFNRRYR